VHCYIWYSEEGAGRAAAPLNNKCNCPPINGQCTDFIIYRFTHFRRSQLHWLDVVDRVRFRVCVQVFRCLHKMSPEYLSTYCQPVSGISGRRHLRSADRGHVDFRRVRLASYGGRSFAFAGPSNWNSLPAYLRDSSLSLSSFKHHLKTFLFSFY